MCEHFENQTAHAGQNGKPEAAKKVRVTFSDEAATGFAKAMKQLFRQASPNQPTAKKSDTENNHGR